MSQPVGKTGWDIMDTEPLELLRQLGGYYECPKDETGKRLGPLVGYAGKYGICNTDPGSEELQYVGDVYANFAIAEQYTEIYQIWGDRLKFDIEPLQANVVMGMPMGGITVGFSLVAGIHTRFIFAEKKVTTLATPLLREQSKLVLSRHELHADDRVIIAEDVTNNFSTAASAVALIKAHGATPVGIVSWLNRSETTAIQVQGSLLPVVSLIHKPFPQYRQDDPAVEADIKAGNIVLKPKYEWARLEAAMGAARPRRMW